MGLEDKHTSEDGKANETDDKAGQVQTTTPKGKQNTAIKVTVSRNSKRLTFDIKYDVLKCNEVMHCIHTVIENQRSRQFSEESSFDYFFRLTDVELQEVKESLNHTMYQNRVFRDVWDKCNFSQPLEQFPSCVSFVFGLEGKNGLGYVF